MAAISPDHPQSFATREQGTGPRLGWHRTALGFAVFAGVVSGAAMADVGAAVARSMLVLLVAFGMVSATRRAGQRGERRSRMQR
jgi:hypothetical protein